MSERINFQLAPEYLHLDSWVKNLPQFFSENGETIFKSRNEVKIFRIGDELLNVKSFKIPNWINRIAYVHFRGSKAERSFNYAQKFYSLGVPTPKAVGFVECLSNGLLGKSYYISLHCRYDFTLREVLTRQVDNREEILREWIRFTYEKLHRNNIYHLDYSPGNTLINKSEEGYAFNIIDLNRMSFRNIDFKTGLKNFRQLDTDLPTIALIASEYAALWGIDYSKAVNQLEKFHLRNVRSRSRHASIKESIRSLFRSGRGGK